MDKSVVVVGAVRTTVGRRNGDWSAVHPARLLGAAQRAVLDGVDPAVAGQVIGGTVTEVGEQSFNVTRTAWLAEGLPQQVSATTVDAQCGSSQQAFTLAAGLIGAGITDVAIACCVESMSRIPIGANYGKDLGRPLPKAYQRHYEFLNQFKSAERIAQRHGIGRDRADEFGYLSQQRAAAAWAQGRFDGQVVTGPVETEDGEPTSVARDEGLRETSLDKLAELKPVLPDGIHTAGTSSQISDGASAVLLMTQDRAARLGRTPLARVVDSLLVIHELARIQARFGVVTMCCGGGLGTATLLERL